MKKNIILIFLILTLLISGCMESFLLEEDDAVNIEATVEEVVMQTKVAATVDAARVNSAPIEFLDEGDFGNALNAFVYTYSAEQNEILETWGEPSEFFILFVGGDRQESWYYPEIGKIFTFLNGSIFGEDEIEVSSDVNLRSIYSPNYFSEEMSLDMLLSVCGADEGMILKTDEMIDSGRLIYLKGLSAGFIEDELRFVQSIPVE